MDRFPERARVDAALAQHRTDLRDRRVSDGDAAEPARALRPVGARKRADTGQTGERLIVAAGDAALRGDERLQLLHLRTADGGLNIGHAVVEADDVVVVVDAAARR